MVESSVSNNRILPNEWVPLKVRYRVITLIKSFHNPSVSFVIEQDMDIEEAVEVLYGIHDLELGKKVNIVSDVANLTYFEVTDRNGDVQLYVVQFYIPGLPVFLN